MTHHPFDSEFSFPVGQKILYKLHNRGGLHEILCVFTLIYAHCLSTVSSNIKHRALFKALTIGSC